MMNSRAVSAGCPPLSVAILCASLSPKAGGILPIVQAHAKELSRLGVTVSAHGVWDELAEANRPSWAPIEPHVHRSWLKRFAYAPGLARSLARSRSDLVHQHGLWLYPSIAATRWQKHTGGRMVISTQGMLEPWAVANAASKKRLAARLFERTNLENAACLHCSEAEVEGVRAFGLKNPIAVIPNGAGSVPPSKRFARPSWLPNDGRKTLLFLGRLHPKKGIRETLDAWALLTARDPGMAERWRLVIAGWDDGGHAEGFVTHAGTLGLNGVLFPGPLYGDDKESLLAHADAFILASRSEGLPMAVLEAWAHGLPVFMTRACNLSQGFEAGAALEIGTGSEDIAAALSHHLEAPELAGAGSRGRDLVREHFSWPAIAKDLLAVYEWILRKGTRPACVISE